MRKWRRKVIGIGRILRCVRIVFSPDAHKFIEMMRAQNTRITRQIVEIIHNNGNE